MDIGFPKPRNLSDRRPHIHHRLKASASRWLDDFQGPWYLFEVLSEYIQDYNISYYIYIYILLLLLLLLLLSLFIIITIIVIYYY